MKKKIFSAFSLLAMIAIPLTVLANVISVGQIVYPTVTIANGASTSSAVSTAGMELVGCQLPATFTSTALSLKWQLLSVELIRSLITLAEKYLTLLLKENIFRLPQPILQVFNFLKSYPMLLKAALEAWFVQ